MPLSKKLTEALTVAGLCYAGNFGEHNRLLAVLEAFICVKHKCHNTVLEYGLLWGSNKG